MLKLCFNNIEVVNDFNILLCNILAGKSLPTFMSKTVVRAITYNHYDAIGQVRRRPSQNNWLDQNVISIGISKNVVLVSGCKVIA